MIKIVEKVAGIGVWECKGDVNDMRNRSPSYIKETTKEVLGILRGRIGQHLGD